VRLLLFLITIFVCKVLFAHGTIIIKNVKHDQGYLAIEAIRKKATKGETIIPLSKIHEGKIAIVVYHDEDSNNELKTGFFWRPKEGFAFSNNYTPKGPPRFKKALINLEHGEPVIIELNY